MRSDILQCYRDIRDLHIGSVLTNDEGRIYRSITFMSGESRVTLLLYAEDDDPTTIRP